MNNLTVIIPSKTEDNLYPCLDAVRQHEPDVNIVVMDDGLDQWKFNFEMLDGRWLSPLSVWWNCPKPFIFSRNVNLGIKAFPKDDIVICNDDALLKTPGGFSAMQNAAEENRDYGVIASTTNNVGNIRQYPFPGGGLREEPRMACFVCVLIPRRTIELVGLLDERFGGNDADTGEVIYGHEDDDYCLRVRNAGLKIGICDDCFVDHASLKSTFRGSGNVSIEPSRRVFQEKWGVGVA